MTKINDTKSNKRIVFTAGLLMALFVAFVPLVGSDANVAYGTELDELNNEIKDKQKELDKGKEEEENLIKAITELEEQIDQLQIEIDNGEEELAQLEKDLEEAQKKVEEQNKALSTRLRNMYKNGSVGFMDVLLNSGSFSDFLTNYDMVQRVYKNDEEVLAQMQEAHDAIERQKSEVEVLQAQLEDARDTAAQEVAVVAEEKDKIAKSNKKTAEMIDDLQDEMEAVQAEMMRKQETGEMSSSKTSKYTGGQFLWPTPGNNTITSPYGWRICPFHGREFHAAIDIGAPSGADIVASAGGTVVHSGWNGGFGKSVMIDHGGGLVTQYNHCSSTLVSVGQKVKKGQVVAKVGSTGYSTGPHLDYRVYKNGDVVDPRGYLQ